ncbi:hypothetical protein VD0004_g7614 [Verticillium dahliae]|nr:hypothetical protein VD0004_g7614 [Verticillium dahliae]
MPRRRRPPRAGAMAELPPLRIATQIATLQALYYVGAIILMLFTALVAGISFTLDVVFGWDAVRGDTTQGWLCGFVLVLDGGFCMYGSLDTSLYSYPPASSSPPLLEFPLSLHLWRCPNG